MKGRVHKEREHTGLKFTCPNCGQFVRSNTKDCRPAHGNVVRRRRVCSSCKKIFSTLEVLYSSKRISKGTEFLLIPKNIVSKVLEVLENL